MIYAFFDVFQFFYGRFWPREVFQSLPRARGINPDKVSAQTGPRGPDSTTFLHFFSVDFFSDVDNNFSTPKQFFQRRTISSTSKTIFRRRTKNFRRRTNPHPPCSHYSGDGNMTNHCPWECDEGRFSQRPSIDPIDWSIA